MKCYYEVLGIERNSTPDQIKKAHRKLALRWHPDKNKDNAEEAHRVYQVIQEAYDCLSDLQEKAFYDILKSLCVKYDFTYPEDKLLNLKKQVKVVVDDKAKYADWNKRANIKAELKVDLILLLAENGYPPVDKDEVYQEIFEQAENFKKYNK